MKLDKIIEPVKNDFEVCRQLYNDTLSHDDSLLNMILSFIGKRQGKMMRPLLVLLTGRLLSKESISLIQLATAYELFHTASLVHDDVVDDSDERRGQASVKHMFTNKCAVLAGDYLLSQTLSYISRANNPVLVNIMSEAASCLASGELLQLSEDNEQHYLRIIENKTAALFRACAESGAVAVGATDEDRKKMRELGYCIGMLFQIKDDMLDKEKDEDTGQKLISQYLTRAKVLINSYPESDIQEALIAYTEYTVNRNN